MFRLKLYAMLDLFKKLLSRGQTILPALFFTNPVGKGYANEPDLVSFEPFHPLFFLPYELFQLSPIRSKAG